MIRKIIVTGGDGRFAKELSKIKTKYKFIFRNKKQLNILSTSSIKKNFKKYKPDCVIHLAGRTTIQNEKNHSYDEYFRDNVEETLKLAKVCAKANVKRFIFISSIGSISVFPFISCCSPSTKSLRELIVARL